LFCNIYLVLLLACKIICYLALVNNEPCNMANISKLTYLTGILWRLATWGFPSCKKFHHRSRLNFINVIGTPFMQVDLIAQKKTVKSAVSLGAFGTYEHKSCTLNVGEIDTRLQTKEAKTTTQPQPPSVENNNNLSNSWERASLLWIWRH